MNRVVRIVLNNRRAHIHTGGELFDELNNFFRYRKPGWDYTPAGRLYLAWKEKVRKGLAEEDEPEGWDGYIHLMQGNSIGTGVFLALREELEKEFGVTFRVEDERVPVALRYDFSLALDLGDKARPYQVDCLKAMHAASKTGGLILNATGTGKTFVAGMYLKALKGPALFLVDELTLLKQAQKELQSVIGEEVGEIGNSVYKPERITVATVQTIHKHRFDPTYVPWTRTLKAIFIDEVHLALNRRNFSTIAVIRPPVVFGLTATLELKKKNVAYRAYDLCGPVVFDYPLEKGVEEGYLSKGVAIAVQVEQDIKAQKIKGNPRWRWVRERYKQQYHELYRDVVVEGRVRNFVILDLIQAAHEKGKHVVVLLNRVQHLKDLSKRLDLKHRLVFGAVAVEDRVSAQKHFEEEKYRIILTNVVFKKGINIKKIDVIIDGAAMKSKNDAVQKYGRGVRLCDGKDGLIYFDIADVGNKFEKAAKSRAAALKRAKIPIFKVSSKRGAQQIMALAQGKLSRELRKNERAGETK